MKLEEFELELEKVKINDECSFDRKNDFIRSIYTYLNFMSNFIEVDNFIITRISTNMIIDLENEILTLDFMDYHELIFMAELAKYKLFGIEPDKLFLEMNGYGHHFQSKFEYFKHK